MDPRVKPEDDEGAVTPNKNGPPFGGPFVVKL